MPNRTISLPHDVVPIIERLGVPFSTWVAEQLREFDRRGAALTLGDQLLRDAELTGSSRPSDAAIRAISARMERSAPW